MFMKLLCAIRAERGLAFGAVLFLCTAVTAQLQTPMQPVGIDILYAMDSGLIAHAGLGLETVYSEVVEVPDAAGLRIYFDRVRLEDASFVRMTSLLDGEVQELNLRSMKMWGDSSAYFNGPVVQVELVAAPGTLNRFSIGEVSMMLDVHTLGGQDNCGICGNDDRVPSSEPWSARLLPAGCTASIFDDQSCMVTAGHCTGGSMTVQFNVPNSNGNCSINNPPVSDQFPVTGNTSTGNGGVGNDWAVLATGTNNIGQTAFERMGEFRPIATAPPGGGNQLTVWSYGVDATCTRSLTQQTSGGPLNSVSSSFFTFSVDIQGGSSGSALIRNGQILGIVTHCPGGGGCPNFGTRVDLAAFVTARESLCGAKPPEPPINDECAAAINLGSGNITEPFDNTLATSGPNGTPNLDPACDGFGDSPGILADLWYRWTAPSNGTTRFHTCDGGLDTKMAVYDVPCVPGAATELACSDDGDCPAGGPASDITIPVIADTEYLVRVGQWGTDGGDQGPTGPGTLSIEFTPAPDVFGACCLDEQCFVLTPADCKAINGVYQGDNTNCTPNPCLPPTGACCLDGGGCIVVSNSDCDLGGGTYQGDDVPCGNCPPPPPVCPWDCEATPDGVIGIVDLLALLAAWGGPGDCDFNQSGTIDIVDLLELLANWGPCP